MLQFYVVTFCAYGTGAFQVSYNAFLLKKDAEQEAKELRACGHTQVKITRVDLKK